MIDDDEEFLNDVWFSDEAYFLLNGHVSSKNLVFWESENPHRHWMSSAFKKVNSMDCHLKAWHYWTIFLWRWLGHHSDSDLQRFLKAIIYESNPHTIAALKVPITEKICRERITLPIAPDLQPQTPQIQMITQEEMSMHYQELCMLHSTVPLTCSSHRSISFHESMPHQAIWL